MLESSHIELTEIVNPENVRPNGRTYQDVLQKLEKREEKLSFSSMRAFMPPAGNPRRFLAYKLNERKITGAIHKGRILDVLLTEGEEAAKDKFQIAEKPDLRTKAGKAEWEAVHQQAQRDSKEIVSQADWDNAEYLAERAMKNPASRWVLDQVTDTQVGAEGELFGWNWRGYLDFQGPGIICDLKRKKSAEPKKVYWQVRDSNEILQLCLYDQMTGGNSDLYTIVLDEQGDVCVVRYSDIDKRNALQKLEQYVNELNRCILRGDFWRSYDYWSPNRDGIFMYSELR